MQNIQLSSERLYLREIESSDVSAIYDYAKRDEVAKYTLWDSQSLKETEAFVQQVQKDHLEIPRVEFELAIVLRESHELIGTVNLTHDGRNKGAEIGYALHPNFRHRGYATEATQTLMDFAFTQLQCHRVFAKADVRNVTSHGVLEKLGFRREGEMREHMWLKNQWRSSFFYAVLKSEWTARK